MSAELVLGRPGFGKTEYLSEKFIKSANEANHQDTIFGGRDLFIVPDQYTVKTEKYLIDKFGAEITTKVFVLSIKRLCSFTFSALGLKHASRSAGVSAMISAMALKEISPTLSYLGQVNTLPVIQTVSETIKGFNDYQITPEALFSVASASKNKKLEDMALILHTYNSLLERFGYQTQSPETLLAEMLDESALLKDTNIYFDFFNGFNASELELIKVIAKEAKSITVATKGDSLVQTNEAHLFSPVKKDISRLYSALCEGAGSCKVTILNTASIKRAPELEFLEENIFRYNGKKFEEKTDNITVYAAKDMNDEIDFIASEIIRLVREEKYRFSDFGIIFRDIEAYSTAIEMFFPMYGIPYLYHKADSLLKKPIAALIDSFLEIAANGYTKEEIIRLLKTGFFSFSKDDIAHFEEYMELWNSEYARFEKPFTRNVNGCTNKRDEESDSILKKNNEIRRFIVDKVKAFKSTKERTVRNTAEALFNFLEDIGAEHTIDASAEFCRRLNAQDLYAEHKQTFSAIIDALDEMVEAIGEETVTTEEFKNLFMILLDTKKLSIIPTAIDEVLMGNINSIPTGGQKIVFTVGMNDGLFPKTVADTGLINDSERTILEKNGFIYQRTSAQNTFYERYLVYLAISVPTEKLYATYSLTIDGSLYIPSYALNDIEELFPSCRKISSVSQDFSERIQVKEPSYLYLTDSAPELVKSVFGDAETFEKDKETGLLTEETAHELFTLSPRMSASRAETFFECPYLFFAKYGLSIQEKKDASLSPINVGNYLHATLENVISNGLKNMSDEEISSAVDTFSQKYLKDTFQSEKDEHAFLARFELTKKKLKNQLKEFKAELMESKFEPTDLELSIGHKDGIAPLKLETENYDLSLTGYIDRIDTYRKDGVCYVRIIDYKNKNKSFDMKDFEKGTLIQMPLYMAAICESAAARYGDNLRPAGFYYVKTLPSISKLASPLQTPQPDSRTNNGVITEDVEIIKAMAPNNTQNLLPKTLLSQSEFEDLFRKVKDHLINMGDKLYSGDLAPKKCSSCKYCIIKDYCASLTKKKEKEENENGN